MQRGLTIIELLVALAVVAILAAIAVPTYKGIRTRSMKRAGEADLQAIKLAVEQYRTINRTYGPPPTGSSGNPCPNPMLFQSDGSTVTRDDISDCYPGANLGNQPKPYDFSVEVCNNGMDYRICATGRTGTPVAGDSICVDEKNNWGDSTSITCP